jgi:hypothetical protein
VKSLVDLADKAGKPIAIEKLDFAERKAQLETVDRRRSRILSALAYRMASELA